MVGGRGRAGVWGQTPSNGNSRERNNGIPVSSTLNQKLVQKKLTKNNFHEFFFSIRFAENCEDILMSHVATLLTNL